MNLKIRTAHVFMKAETEPHTFLWRLNRTLLCAVQFFSRIFQRKISAHRLALVGMAGGVLLG